MGVGFFFVEDPRRGGSPLGGGGGQISFRGRIFQPRRYVADARMATVCE